MPYNRIGGKGQFTTTFTTQNDCNLLTMDNQLMLCGDINVEDYNGQTLLELSETSMYPAHDLYIPVSITELRTNLLQNSEHCNITLAPFTNSTAVATTPDYDGETNYYCNFNQNRAVIVDFPNLEVGKKYCFSYQCCRNPIQTSSVNQHQVTIDGNTYYQGRVEHGLWKTFKAVFTASSSSTSAEIILGFPSQTTNFGGYFRHFYLGEWDTDWFSGENIPFYSNSIMKINTNGELTLENSYPKAIIHTNGITIHLNDKYYNAAIGNIYNDGSSPL